LRVQILVLKLLHYLLFAFKGRVSSSIRFRLNHFISKILRGFHGGCACRRVLHVVSVATANISLLLVSEQQIAVILTLFLHCASRSFVKTVLLRKRQSKIKRQEGSQ
jgi:hypothetical protein